MKNNENPKRAPLKTKNKVGFASVAVLLVACIVFNIAMIANCDAIALANGTITTKNIDRAYTLSEGTDVATKLEEEGATLLYNANNTLPLSKETKVTILGAGSFNYVQGGTGSAGGRDDSNTAMMNVAFENAGIDYNKTAWEWMSNALGAGANIHNGGNNASYMADGDPASGFDWTAYRDIHEFTIATYEKFVTADVIGEYNDVAIVTFSRSGAEGASPSLDYDGNKDTTTGRVYLELDDNEKDLLEFCKKNFKKTVVLVNSAEPIECGFINNDDYNVEAVLWIGHPGEAGMYGVANILGGVTSPSGHVVDTWTYDMTTNPTFYSANDQSYANVNTSSKSTKYYEYNEGIYVGYRYYETADAMGYFDSAAFQSIKFKGNLSEGKYFSDVDVNGSYEEQKVIGPQATYSGYDEVVQFPFGYGLSYTTFKQEIVSSDIKLEAHGTNSVTIKVTNTGDYAGKDVIQLYMEAPYAQDSGLGIKGVGLEVPKVVLMGFDKTKVLQPGESETITIEFSTDDLTTYDEFGQGTYVLEKGEYIFHVSPNAHGWANEEDYGVDYDTVSANLENTLVYDEDGEGVRVITINGVTVREESTASNKLNDVTAGDGAMLINGGASGTYKLGYLSRSDFHAGMIEILSYQSDDLTGKYSGNGYVWSADGKGTTPVVTGSTAGKRDAATIVKEAMETAPMELVGSDGFSEGMKYLYETILADGISFGSGGTFEILYGYGNNNFILQKYTEEGLLQTDESYLTSDHGLIIAWNALYYVALNADGETVKDTDGYVKIYDSESAAAAEGTATKLQVEHMAGVPSDDVRWDKLTNMLSFKEADTLAGDNAWHTQSAESIGKLFSLAVDGPGEAGNAQNADCTWWPCACIIAATWNTELAEAEGVAYGHQDLLNNTPYCYAPAMNLHRTPFGGRDFEYYSEDGFISGMIGGHVVQGLQSTGMHVFIKHCALNDSDTNRNGVNTWASESAIRSLYLRPYEIATKYFNADGIMGALNSIGMAWSHYGFHVGIMRDEWGWDGMLITDGDGSSSDVYNNYSFWYMAEGGLLGTGPLSNGNTYVTIDSEGNGATNYVKHMIHELARNAVYQYSHNIDALNALTTITPNDTLPIIIIAVGNVVLLGAAAIVLFAVAMPKKRKVRVVKK